MVLREGGDPSNIADYRPQIQPNTGDYTDSATLLADDGEDGDGAH